MTLVQKHEKVLNVCDFQSMEPTSSLAFEPPNLWEYPGEKKITKKILPFQSSVLNQHKNVISCILTLNEADYILIAVCMFQSRILV